MYSMTRKTAPQVKNGKVQFKNRWNVSPSYQNSTLDEWIIDRQKPGSGYRHLVHQADLRQFLERLPDWDTLRVGLDAVVLAPGDPYLLGWHRTGIVALSAWDRNIIAEGFDWEFVAEHATILEKLRVPCVQDKGTWTMEFRESSARAFQLVHVLIHELGHHHDRMTTRTKRSPSRGEGFAESYANRHEDEILDIYWQVFPDDY